MDGREWDFPSGEGTWDLGRHDLGVQVHKGKLAKSPFPGHNNAHKLQRPNFHLNIKVLEGEVWMTMEWSTCGVVLHP